MTWRGEPRSQPGEGAPAARLSLAGIAHRADLLRPVRSAPPVGATIALIAASAAMAIAFAGNTNVVSARKHSARVGYLLIVCRDEL